ncbi:MAG: prepilin peptidase [Halothiobacillaceae bacterium]
MNIITLIAENPWLLASSTLVLGLVVGSFLNVVIHRLPIMLERGWRRECEQLLHEEIPDTHHSDSPPAQCRVEDQPGPYNLVTPRSCCPNCGHRISAIENIPLLSWLFLRGRCAACGARISLQYPLIELGTGVLTMLVALIYGDSWQTLFGMMFVWFLITAAMIDLKTTLLPDALTLPLLWAGLLIAWAGIGTEVSLHDAVIGAAAGYLLLWSVYWGFRLLTGKEGMGFGDFKLLAALGAWLGWQMLPLVILLSSLVGAVVGILLITLRGHDRQVPIPFGPYLAMAGLIAYLAGPSMIDAYRSLLGL